MLKGIASRGFEGLLLYLTYPWAARVASRMEAGRPVEYRGYQQGVILEGVAAMDNSLISQNLPPTFSGRQRSPRT